MSAVLGPPARYLHEPTPDKQCQFLNFELHPNVAEIFGGGSPESRISGGCTECCQPERSFTLREDWQREYRRRKCRYTGQRSGSSPKIIATLGFRWALPGHPALFSALFATHPRHPA